MVHTTKIKGSDWVVCISGFRDVIIDDVDKILALVGATVSPNIFQLFNADRIGGWEHIYFAAVNAVNAFETELAISKSLAIEVLVYASCQSQISAAFDILGISTFSERIALLVMAENTYDAERALNQASRLLGTKDDSVLDMSDKKFEELKQAYSITDLELETVERITDNAITHLLIERGSLLPVRR
jgi:tRNA threonylcarbamoyladenosine modification (KEOPS) complex Cgi121 subunit